MANLTLKIVKISWRTFAVVAIRKLIVSEVNRIFTSSQGQSVENTRIN